MPRKLLCNVEQNPGVKERLERINAMKEHFSDRMKFIEAQAKKIDEEYEAEHTVLWGGLRSYLQTEKIGADWYDPSKWHLHWDNEVGILFACDEKHSSGGLAEFIAGLVPIK